MGIKMLRLPGPGKNLVDFNEIRVSSSTWATADKTKGFEINADVYDKAIGSTLGGNGNCFGAFVPCKKGESISLDFFNYAPYYGRCFYCEVDADFKVLTTPVQFSNGSSALTQKTFTATDDNCIGFAIEWYINSSQTRNYTKENYMVVKGTTVPTAYEPYMPYIYCPGVQIPSRYQPATSGDTTKYPQTLTGWGTKVLNGTESWTYTAAVPRFTMELAGSIKADNQTEPVCSHYIGYKTGGSISVSKGCGIFASGGTYGTLLVKDTDYTTVEGFKAYLASEHVTVLYKLATSDDSVWDFVKDTKDNVFGYLKRNDPLKAFVKAYGATGTQSSTVVYDHFMLKGGNE